MEVGGPRVIHAGSGRGVVDMQHESTPTIVVLDVKQLETNNIKKQTFCHTQVLPAPRKLLLWQVDQSWHQCRLG